MLRMYLRYDKHKRMRIKRVNFFITLCLQSRMLRILLQL